MQELTDAVANATDSADWFAVLRRGAPLQRSLCNASLAFERLAQELPAKETVKFRDLSAEMIRSVEIIMTEARHGLDFTMAERAEEQAAEQFKRWPVPRIS